MFKSRVAYVSYRKHPSNHILSTVVFLWLHCNVATGSDPQALPLCSCRPQNSPPGRTLPEAGEREAAAAARGAPFPPPTCRPSPRSARSADLAAAPAQKQCIIERSTQTSDCATTTQLKKTEVIQHIQTGVRMTDEVDNVKILFKTNVHFTSLAT